MIERYIVAAGVGISGPDGLAHVFWEQCRYAFPFSKACAIAHAVWALPDPAFGWEVAKLASGNGIDGHCATCGQGFREYIFCKSNECKWINDSERNVNISFGQAGDIEAHKQRLRHEGAAVALPDPNGWGVL
jgi:hypothetical protein